MTSTQTILPPSLKPNATIGLVAPAGPIESAKFRTSVNILKNQGFAVIYRKDILTKKGHLAGSDQRRAEELHEMFLNPDVEAVFCVRGGFGCSRLIPLLKPSIFKEHPKIFMGFSDITTLHVFFQHMGIASFHGPSLGQLRVPKIRTPFLKDLESTLVRGNSTIIKGRSFTKVIRPGEASGTLVGGNLRVLSHTLGTPFEMDTHDKILLIEEVNEAPYRLDRLITHLKLANKLSSLRGLIIGQITYDPHLFRAKQIRPKDIYAVFQDHFGSAPYPVVFNFPFGHGQYNPIIPLGVTGKLNTNDCSLIIVPAVR